MPDAAGNILDRSETEESVMEKKSAAKKTSKAFKIIGGTVLALLVLFLVIREIGRGINGRTPEGGINESMYIDVNGTEQWINIYG